MPLPKVGTDSPEGPLCFVFSEIPREPFSGTLIAQIGVQVPFTAPVFVSVRFKDKEDNEPHLISKVPGGSLGFLAKIVEDRIG